MAKILDRPLRASVLDHRTAQLKLIDAHPLVRECILDMRTSNDRLIRALRIMDALIKITERMGAHWSSKVGEPVRVKVDGVPIKIVVRELQSQTKYKNPPGSYYEFRQVRKWSGKLCIEIDELAGDCVRRRWADTPKAKLESKLGEVVAGLHRIAIAIRADEAEWLERDRARQVEREREERHAAAIERERANRLALAAIASRWRDAEDIRRFVEHAKGLLWHLPLERQKLAAAWLGWALEQADSKDPLEGGWSRLFDHTKLFTSVRGDESK